MNKSNIKALYFDLDHTLWDFEKTLHWPLKLFLSIMT